MAYDGEEDLDLVEPGGVHRELHESSAGPALVEPVDGALAVMAAVVVDHPEHPPGRGVRLGGHDLFHETTERGDAGGGLATAKHLGSVHIPGGQVGQGAAPFVFVLDLGDRRLSGVVRSRRARREEALEAKIAQAQLVGDLATAAIAATELAVEQQTSNEEVLRILGQSHADTKRFLRVIPIALVGGLSSGYGTALLVAGRTNVGIVLSAAGDALILLSAYKLRWPNAEAQTETAVMSRTEARVWAALALAVTVLLGVIQLWVALRVAGR